MINWEIFSSNNHCFCVLILNFMCKSFNVNDSYRGKITLIIKIIIIIEEKKNYTPGKALSLFSIMPEIKSVVKFKGEPWKYYG